MRLTALIVLALASLSPMPAAQAAKVPAAKFYAPTSLSVMDYMGEPTLFVSASLSNGGWLLGLGDAKKWPGAWAGYFPVDLGLVDGMLLDRRPCAVGGSARLRVPDDFPYIFSTSTTFDASGIARMPPTPTTNPAWLTADSRAYPMGWTPFVLDYYCYCPTPLSQCGNNAAPQFVVLAFRVRLP